MVEETDQEKAARAVTARPPCPKAAHKILSRALRDLRTGGEDPAAADARIHEDKAIVIEPEEELSVQGLPVPAAAAVHILTAAPKEGFIDFEQPSEVERCRDKADKKLPLKEVVVQRPIEHVRLFRSQKRIRPGRFRFKIRWAGLAGDQGGCRHQVGEVRKGMGQLSRWGRFSGGRRGIVSQPPSCRRPRTNDVPGAIVARM